MTNEVSDTARVTALEECEHKIMNAFRRGLEATCAIAREFRKIDQQELYTDRGYKTFNDYVTKFLRLELTTVHRIIAVSHTIDMLRDAGLRLPENESQAAELARLEPDQQPTVWQRILTKEEEGESITVTLVKRLVDAIKAESPPPEPPARRGVTTALDLEDQEPKTEANGAPRKMTPAAKVPAKVVFTDKGEEALERIKRLCGDRVGNAIANGNLPITERDLLKWSEENDAMVITLGHYIADLRWTVAQALKFENQTLNEATTVGDLMKLAKARAGRYVLELAYVAIVVELIT
jgi:hypothetical protein